MSPGPRPLRARARRRRLHTIRSDDLNAPKARILLLLALSRPSDPR